MHSVQTGMWDPQPPSKHASPLPRPPPEPHPRSAHVTTAAPAKRITFYKSGDSQFAGVRMAVHKRSFKCFDALLDDLSQKMPLPFGVRTVTTPRGTHTISHLEQLQDGGCYLCSDRRQTKPVDMDLVSKQPNIWYHHSHRPHRPDFTPTMPTGHVPHRQHRRILLVKNSDPGLRRSVVLSRRSARSLKAFLDEVSEVMQFHVRKLYTAEGRRIDSAQSLMTCPGVLVCVGREAFSPTLINFIRKNSEEKLPGLGSRSSGLGPRTPGNGAKSPATQGARSPPHGAQSRASEYSEGHDSKKNVNFGLETKKSIIHPRSDSSNRSTRFSLSSDKSYSNGISADSQARPAVMNEDIEKRVLVNKDGSLSVEMRVRFRLQSDETLQWSTQIQKRPSLTNECCPLTQAQTHYLQQAQSESCSDPDSASYDPEAPDYSAQQLPGGNHCPCCYQRQEQQYDLWENPMHSRKYAHVPDPHATIHSHTITRHTHSSSSSSSCNSRRVVRCRARLSNCTGDMASEQRHLVQEEMCMTEHLERRVEVEQNGDSHVEVCRVSRCCSRSSEVVATDTSLQPSSGKLVEDELKMEEGEEPALSTVSSSSHVLQSLREDQDDDLPPSASQCSHRNESAATGYNQQAGDNCDGCVQGEGSGSRAVSADLACHCGVSSPHSIVEAKKEMDASQSCHSRISRASCKSSKSPIPAPEVEEAADKADEGIKRVASGMSAHTGHSGTSSVCPNCGGCKSKITSNSTSRASNRSHHSDHNSHNPATPVSKQDKGSDISEDDIGSNDSAVSTQSNKSNLTNIRLPNGPEDRAPSATSTRSHKSCCNDRISEGAEEVRSPSAQSQKSKCSITAEENCHKSAEEVHRVCSSLSAKSCAHSDKSNISGKLGKAERPNSAISAKSNKSKASVKSGTSHRSSCSHCGRSASPGIAEPLVDTTEQGVRTEIEERTPSVLSAKSGKTSEKSLSSKVEVKEVERVMSQMSGKSVNSNLSVKSSKSNCNGSCKSHKSNCSKSQEARPEVEDQTEDGQEHHKRAASALSEKSDSPAKSNGDASPRGVSPSTNEVKEGTFSSRTPSAISGKSHTSTKSSKSQKSSCTSSAQNPNQDFGPMAEVDGDEKQTQERVASALSAKSKSSARSGTSHKSKSNLGVKSLSPNVVTIKTPDDEEGHDTAERAQSSVSTTSNKSNVSHKSGQDKAAVVDKTDADEYNKAISKSSQVSNSQTLPCTKGEERRGQSALSVKSIKSTNSGKSKCSCGAASVKKEKEELNDKSTKCEEAASIQSPSTQRGRIQSGGSDQPLSRTSSGSVSLGLPTDTGDSDSGKSGVYCNETSDGPNEESILNEDAMETVSTDSKKSKHAESVLSKNTPAVKIPAIETPERTEDKGEESGEKSATASSAISAKSNKSKKSHCSCATEARSVKSSSKKDVHEANNTDNRTLSALSSSEKVRSKSSRSASANSVTPMENKSDSRPASEATEKKSQSPCCLLPESASAPLDPSNTDKSPGANSRDSVKTSSTPKKDKPLKSSSPCPLRASRSGSKVETCSESILSQTLSAADLLKETMYAPRPNSQRSKASKTSQKTKSKKDLESGNLDHQEDTEELTPACLPNASPSEVVSDWLRSIPADSTMLTIGDEEDGKDKGDEENPEEEGAKREASSGNDDINEEEVGAKGEEEEAGEEDAENKSSDPVPAEPVDNSYQHTLLLKGEPLPRNWQSSTAVMKVLLSSSLGRCRSLPEVSPSYGRRLSTSARGFLDCLAQLHLIDPSVNADQPKDRRYEDIMAILQSLWLTEPGDFLAKDNGEEQVTPPRSSSGVGMSSGSGGSGKENGNQEGDETDQNQTNNNEAECLHEIEGVEKTEELEQCGEGTEATQAGAKDTMDSVVPPSLDSPKATDTDMSSPNDGSKSPTDNEHETPGDSGSGTPPTVLQAPLSKKPSQDPDPVWILHLLKKLEKQFMNHYVDAMSEFKVRWDLSDSIILDTMISELKQEVSRRIQSSIQREVKKIQGRAGRLGRSPRPPKGTNLSRDSSTTEKRRRMMRVLKNQSVKTADSISDEEMTGEFSDQRSDDEYCPCDACVRKKMAARPFKANPQAAEAPVVMEFDLLKILQLKKSPLPAAAAAPPPPPPPQEEQSDSVFLDEEGRNLDVVEEEEEEEEVVEGEEGEEEETKGDIQADIILEATIQEEDEEGEDDNRGEEGTSEGEGDETDERQEEGEGEEEVENGEEEEEEEETQCQCQCGQPEEGSEEEEEGESSNRGDTAEEDSASADNDGETGAEGESDMETVKEATTGEEETTGNGENEEDEETGGQESADEEQPKETGDGSEDRDDNAAEEENGETREKVRKASEEERATPQGATEGEEADAEESDTDNKHPSDTSCDESGNKEGGEEEEEEKAAVASKTEEEEEEEEEEDVKTEDSALFHQFTKTSVESQPGSLEEVDMNPSQNPVHAIEVPKVGAGGGGSGQRRSRSPARIKRHKPKGSDGAEMGDF